jgi:tRNA modification GTPase
LQRAQESLQEAITLVESGGDHDLAAAEMRLALNALGEVTGEIYTAAILDRIFSRFCIGK